MKDFEDREDQLEESISEEDKADKNEKKLEVIDDEVLDALLEKVLSEELEQEERVVPCIPLRGLSVFPRTIMHFDIGREKSIKALE